MARITREHGLGLAIPREVAIIGKRAAVLDRRDVFMTTNEGRLRNAGRPVRGRRMRASLHTGGRAVTVARAGFGAILAMLSGRRARLLAEENYRLRAECERLRTDVDYQLLMAHQTLLAALRDLDPEFEEVYEAAKKFTMTSVERLFSLYKAVQYVVKSELPGDFAECGVWRGGSMMLVAHTLNRLGDRRRRIYLFDTFEGHPKPDAKLDVDLWGN